MRRLRFLPLLLAALSAACGPGAGAPRDSQTSGDRPTSVTRLTEADIPALAETVSRLWRGESPRAVPPALRRPSEGVYLAIRSRGRRVHHLWKLGGTVLDGLAEGLAEAHDQALSTGDAETVDAVEIDIVGSYEDFGPGTDAADLPPDADRGVRGLWVLLEDGRTLRYAPTLMLATNRSFRSQIDLLVDEQLRQAGAPDSADAARRVRESMRYGPFDAEQVLVRLGDAPVATLMTRGNTLVPVSAVTREGTTDLTRSMEAWLTGAVQPDGRLVYAYWPSRAEETRRNNMIRQWMSTVALGRVAAAHPERDDLWPLARRNIEYNLARFYSDEDEGQLGVIEFEGKVKLGAVALAALALVGHPDRATWAREERGLRRTVDLLWDDSGRFRTWYRAPGPVRDQQNFYPGEALLLWATLYADRPDPALLERLLRSFDHYRAWHLEPAHRNPAFVPWHTQAWCTLWAALPEHARRDELRDFVFEMNDWLLGLQQWEDAAHPDFRGRFYDPDRSHFGPPHASATGVYVEGLVDACRLAREVGDTARAEAYRVAIVRATRSLMQLQFRDDVDTYYVHYPRHVLGGLRTTVYDNVIRNDNVQHGLMGLLEVLELFDGNDYRHP